MSAPLRHCASCGAPFARLREAQRTCSPACKQALYRAEKCNAVGAVSSEGENALRDTPAGRELIGFVRIWGPNKLSEIELRIMKLEPTGLHAKGGSMLYRRIAE